MAKKRSKESPESREGIHSRQSPQDLRFGEVSLDTLLDLHTACELKLTEIKQAIDQALTLDAKSVLMDGCMQFSNAAKLLEKFESNLGKAVGKVRLQAAIAARKASGK